MSTQIIDSDRRCPFDGKRMLVEIGQDDNSATDRLSIRVRMVHQCLHCGHEEIEENWKRPRIKPTSNAAAERLAKLRAEGTVIPLVYDDSPWPEEEWADADAS